MVLLYLFIAAVIFTGILFSLMLRGYKNKSVPHKHTPADYDIPFEEVRIPAKKRLTLYGWWIPGLNENKPTVILVHGWNRNLERTMPYIIELHKKGYNLLAFDSRNHGSSDTDGYSTMLKFAEDIKAAIDYLVQNRNLSAGKVSLTGLSIGGAASIYISAHDRRVEKVVAVGAFADPFKLMLNELKKRHIPTPLAKIFLKYVQLREGIDFKKIAPVNNIGKSYAQILLVHGTNDETVPFSDAEELLEAGKRDRVQLLPLKGKGHSDCHEHPGFWKKTEEFL